MKSVDMKFFHLPKDASIELIVLVLNQAGLNVTDNSELESKLKKLGATFD